MDRNQIVVRFVLKMQSGRNATHASWWDLYLAKKAAFKGQNLTVAQKRSISRVLNAKFWQLENANRQGQPEPGYVNKENNWALAAVITDKLSNK